MFPMRLEWVSSCKKGLTRRPGIATAGLSGRRSNTGSGKLLGIELLESFD
jgi:hypothetical protein